jgi:dTDP-4-dehydrorhamnose 3,5-epimerase
LEAAALKFTYQPDPGGQCPRVVSVADSLRLNDAMIFTETRLPGAYIIALEPRKDERGFFARSFCRNEFEQRGLNSYVAQSNISFNFKRGILRGMHYQIAPHSEAKLVTCVAGSIYDVLIDLRKDSPTYCQWLAIELSARDRSMLYVPEGFAHGFQTLEDDTTVFYQMFNFYEPAASRGVRWDDPAFAIQWPAAPQFMSPRDSVFPDFER